MPAGGRVDLTTKQLLELGTNFKQQFPQTHPLNSTDKSAEPMGKIQGVAIIGILLSDIARKSPPLENMLRFLGRQKSSINRSSRPKTTRSKATNKPQQISAIQNHISRQKRTILLLAGTAVRVWDWQSSRNYV